MVACTNFGSAWFGGVADWLDEEKDIRWLERKEEELCGC